MSSPPPPAPATENEEAPRPGHAAESAGTAVDARAAASQTASSSRHEGEVMEDEYVDDLDDFDDDMDDVVGDVHADFEEEEGGKFSKSAEVHATLEALWRKVAAIEDKPSPGHTCSVCMEHLTCEGAHRICCIPCGHVYGRSCLERWLQRDGNETARCPQCNVKFAGNQIIDLYAPENLWGGCGRIQEVKVYITKAIAEVVVECDRKMEATMALASSRIAKWEEEQLSSNQKVYAKMRKLEDLMDQGEIERRVRAEVEKANARMDSYFEEKCAELMLIKEQIAATMLPPPPTKPTELQEQGAPAQDSQARRIIKPNKRFYSKEWAR